MTVNSRVALTGATGFVGAAVLDVLEARGILSKALTRRDQDARKGVEWVRGDLANVQALGDLMQGCDVLLHIAGVVNAPDAAGFIEGNVTGTQNVMQAARDAGVKRAVLVSSLSAREPGLSDYGSSKRQGEEAVQTGGVDWVIIRPPAIYGPRDTEIFELFKSAKWGFVPMPPEGRASVIHVDDLARFLVDCTSADADGLSERIFEPDDGREQGWGHGELAKAIGTAMGRNVFAPNLPAAVLRLGAKLDGLLRGKKAKLTPDRVGYMIWPDWVSAAERRPPTDLWKAEIDTAEGLAATAKWYRCQGWL